MNRHRTGRVSRWVTLSAAALPGVLGCAAAVQRNDWSTYRGPGAVYFQQEEYQLPLAPDPLEPVNRLFTGLNDIVLFDGVAAVSAAWRWLTPPPARDCLVNAAANLEYPGRALNHLLQGQFEQAGSETRRFLINSTLGLAGLFDRAAAQGIPAAPTDTGNTLVAWGWRNSTYLVLPLVGPRTPRDTLGLVGDAALDPTTYFFPAGLIKSFVVGSEQIPALKRYSRTSYDPYEPTRMVWMASRPPVAAAAMPSAGSDRAARETLRAAEFRFQDPWFPARARTHRVRLRQRGRPLGCEVWLQPEPAPMVFILPGLGAHRRSQQAVALAEMVYRGGFSAVTLSSTMNFDFMTTAASTPVPGFAPTDARDCHRALDAVAAQLRRRYGARITATVLLGASLGAYHTLMIATERSGGPLVDFDGYLALYPAVSMRDGAERLDAMYNVPLSFSLETRDERVRGIVQSVSQMAMGGRPQPLSEDDARFSIGLSYRLALHDVIWCSQERQDLGVLKTQRHPLRRMAASQEIYDFSFVEYFYAFVLPYALQVGPDQPETAEQMFERMDLRFLADDLRANPRIRVLTNCNDFLLDDGDREWLAEVFGSRLVLEQSGGHMGNIGDPEVQGRIIESITDLLGNRLSPRAAAGRLRSAAR